MPDFKKKYLTLLFFAAAQLALGATFCAPARAYYGEETEKKSFLIKTRVRYWFTSSFSETRAYVVTPASWWVPPTDNLKMGYTDVFKMDSSFPLYSVELQPCIGFSGEFEAGDNRFSGGQFLEHGWLHAKNYTITFLSNGEVWNSPQHRDYSLDTARMKGTARQYSANAYLRIYKSRKVHREDDFELEHNTDLFAGYSWYENTARLYSGYTLLSTNFFLPTPPAGPVTGFDSRSRMILYGWRAGFREQARVSDSLSAEGKFSIGPGMRFSRENYFNLNTSLSDPGVRETASGTLVEFSFSAAWKFRKSFELDGGYLARMYSAYSGTRTYYYTNGAREDWNIDLVKANIKGVFLSLSWKY